MKKYGLLLLMVLAMSTTAWAGPFACVTIDRCVPACEDVTVNVKACLPYDCDYQCQKVCIKGNLILVDLIYDCEDCRCGGATCVDKDVVIEGGVCPGMYVVMVRIYCSCPGPCCHFPRVCALGITTFSVAATRRRIKRRQQSLEHKHQYLRWGEKPSEVTLSP